MYNQVITAILTLLNEHAEKFNDYALSLGDESLDEFTNVQILCANDEEVKKYKNGITVKELNSKSDKVLLFTAKALSDIIATSFNHVMNLQQDVENYQSFMADVDRAKDILTKLLKK